MIEGKVIAYQDDLKAMYWPEIFVDLPRVGDYVQSTSHSHVVAMITRVIHTELMVRSRVDELIKKPFIKIEIRTF